MSDKARFFEGTEMPTAGWWEALWPDPAGVLASIGLKPGMAVIDLCSGDGWFTLQIAKVARLVAAIDIDPTLLEVARVRLMEAGVTNCRFIADDAYDITRLWRREGRAEILNAGRNSTLSLRRHFRVVSHVKATARSGRDAAMSAFGNKADVLIAPTLVSFWG
jgi:tRNA A58 N-methylase Trm61